MLFVSGSSFAVLLRNQAEKQTLTWGPAGNILDVVDQNIFHLTA